MTIDVAAGIYAESDTIASTNPSLDIVGAGASTTVLDDKGDGSDLTITAGNVTISGLTNSGGVANAGSNGVFGTKSMNGAGGNGGGIAVERSASATVTNSMISGNSAGNGGYGGTGGNCSSAVNSDGGDNVASDSSCFASPSATGDVTTLLAGDLGPLTYNGGPTQTIALVGLSTSNPAIGAVRAGCPTTDQRGV